MEFSTLMVATLWAGYLAGGVPALLAVVGPALAEQMGVETRRADRLLRWAQASWILLMPLVGWLADGWGARNVLFTGCIGLALALAWFGLAEKIWPTFGTLLFLALMSAMVTVAATVVMPYALAGDRKFACGAFGLGFTAVAIGYLTTGPLWRLLLGRFGFRQALLALGLGCLAPAILASLAPSDKFPPEVSHALTEGWLEDPRFWLISLALFLYFPLEMVLDVWTRPFLTELGAKEKSLPFLLAGFWLAFLLTRASAGWILREDFEGWFLITLILIGAMTLGNLAGVYAPNSGILGFWLVGAAYGPMLPIYLSMLAAICRGAPATAIGAVYALAALNAVLVKPWFVAYAQTHPVRASMRIPMLLGMVMAAATLVLTLIRKVG